MAPSVQIEYGIIKYWNQDRGFGFATIDYLGDVFIHITTARSTPTEQSFGSDRPTRVPQVGDRVQVVSVPGKRGMRAQVWGFSTRKVVVPLRQPQREGPKRHPAFATAREERLDQVVRCILEGYHVAERRHSAEVINFHEGGAMRDRVRIELERRPERLLAEPTWEACRCMIIPEKISQMEEKDSNCRRIPHATVASTFFVYRIVRHDCPAHINATPIRFMSFRDCGEFPLDNERVTYVGECDDRVNYWPSLVEDPWYQLLKAYGYSDPRDYLDDF